MSKVQLPYVLVIEGPMDQAFLSGFLDCDYIQTNGSAVSRETIEYIKEVAKTRDVVILTDPDSPGERIRDLIAKEIPSCLHAFVRKEVSIKKHKVGVAESTKEEVLFALAHIVPNHPQKTEGLLTFADLSELGLTGGTDSALMRQRVEETFHVGHCNGKKLLKRLNALGISKERLRSAIHG